MTIPTANELLMGSGARAAAFPTVGTIVRGEIVAEPKVQQQTDLDTGEAKTFANGDPMWQIVVVLQTAERDGADDDGIRSLYVKANMQKAVKDAIAEAGAADRGLQTGGQLAVQYSGDGEPKKRGFNAPKLYRAQYQPPVNSANALLGLTSPQPAAAPNAGAAPAGTATPPPPPPNTPLLGAPAAAPPPFLPTPTTPAPAGMDPDVWARLSPAQQATLSGTPASTVPF